MGNPNFKPAIDQLITIYGDGSDGTCPTRAQWEQTLNRSEDTVITLINFFKLRAIADYADTPLSPKKPITGQEAFDQYEAVSGPALTNVGGTFMRVSDFGGVVIAESADWDFILVGSYPNTASLLALFGDPDYLQAYAHRAAACLKQKVIVGNAVPTR